MLSICTQCGLEQVVKVMATNPACALLLRVAQYSVRRCSAFPCPARSSTCSLGNAVPSASQVRLHWLRAPGPRPGLEGPRAKWCRYQ